MIHYQLNMARGFVLPLELRRKWLRWVVLYLLLMAVAIALILNHVVSQMIFWRGQQRLVSTQVAQMLRVHPEYKSVADCKKTLGEEVSACIRDMESILSFGGDQGRIASILLALVEPLPTGLGLGTVNYDGETRKISFDVIMPASLKLEGKITPPKLVALWEKTPLLSKYLSQVEMENSERTRPGGVEALCWRFSAIVGGQ